ncbi:helix-turn-helix domain-containing protein [Pseudobutyrivibrio sp. LB2011]|uniref:helix-turn-helix domain-containing protein n=1 Tax=Pseudobutyrivibrio sp. LB2011 TaxID=1408312 RepID=UPI0005D1F84A|nr:helix-turn-helix transcriptional regulator [Pseudobutyrivibrio sp. LB2011]
MSLRVIDIEATKKRLAEMFEDKGLTPRIIQRELQLDSIQAVYKWTGKGKTVPSLDNLILLAKLMDCQIEDMLVLTEL